MDNNKNNNINIDLTKTLTNKIDLTKSLTGKGEGLRYNSGKLRYDLIHTKSLEDMVKVLTYGSNKYKPYNWIKGLSWKSVLASLKRHISAFEIGEDYDSETGLLHIAHAACNIHFLNAFYYDFPQGDDRPQIVGYKKYGLDIDGVLSEFVKHFFSYLQLEGNLPIHWNDPRIVNNFHKINEDQNFWSTIPQLVKPEEIIYEPYCYITARSIDSNWTQTWLDNNIYPKAKLFSVGRGESKIKIALENNIEVFLDDSYDNFLEFNKNGIDCYLFTAEYNKKHNVGHKRIDNIDDFFKKIEIRKFD